MDIWTPIPCPCGHPSCRNWLVDPVAAVQSVRFTKEEAFLVAAAKDMRDALEACLEWMDEMDGMNRAGEYCSAPRKAARIALAKATVPA